MCQVYGWEKKRVLRECTVGAPSLEGISEAFLEEVVFKLTPQREQKLYLILCHGESSGEI